MRTEHQIRHILLQSFVGAKPLSAHEQVQAKALLEKYCEACESKFYSELPSWAGKAALAYYVEKRDELASNIKEGNFWLVRIEIECPAICPQHEAEGRKL